MKISECSWKDQFVEKLAQKHQVSVGEVEEVLRNAPRFDFVSKGQVRGEMSIGRWDRLTRDGI